MAEFDKRLDLLKNIIDNKDKIFEKINEEKEKLIPIVNITNILGCATDEVKNSSLLHNILKIKFKYENKEINFAKDFALYIVDKIYKDKIKDAKFENVYREFTTKEGGRIDILIIFDKFEIIIENKINARERENQLEDYYNDRYTSNKDIFVVYLTRYGHEAHSINEETKEELKDKIYYLSHDDIAEWIKNDILNKYQFLKDEKFQLIYSALIQIAYNEKYISKKTEENKMEQKIIKDFLNLNSLINNIEGLENRYNESNEYIKLFENTIEAIKEVMLEDEIIKNDIKYSVDVGNHLKQEGINNIIFNEEAIRSDIGEGPFSVSIEIPMIGRHNLKIMLLIHVLGYHTCINIYTDKGDIIKKLKDLKNEIEGIIGKLGEFYIGEEEGEPDNVYFVEIDTTKKDCPKAEETAQKMIDLYDLLKEKITQ